MSLNDYIKIGDKIKRLRTAKGIKQKEMAEDILGIPRSTYSNYENDNRVPDNDSLELIAEKLGLTVNELISGENDSNSQKKQSLGERIKKLRKAKGLTQSDLAENINKSLRMVQKYEANDVAPGLDVIDNIAEALEINRLELLRDKPEKFIAKVSIKDTDIFRRYLEMMKDILVDERIDKNIRQEYYDKYLNEVEK